MRRVEKIIVLCWFVSNI